MTKQKEELIKVNEHGAIGISLPITQPSGKIRVKKRRLFSEYGIPVATCKDSLDDNCYIEWQIGYDVPAKEALRTNLNKINFLNYRGVTKCPYELSEIIYFGYKCNLVKDSQILSLYEDIKSMPRGELIDVDADMQITRTNPRLISMHGLEFYKMSVSYPLIVHEFEQYSIYEEIINREKQRAIGNQPMLYICLPLTSLEFKEPIIGRPAHSKEVAIWHIGEGEAQLALEVFKLFGALSINHNHDTREILRAMFPHLITR